MTAYLVNRDASPIPLRGWANAVLTTACTAHNRHLTLICLFTCLALMLWAGAASALPPVIPQDPQNEVLARVNGEPVTRADLQGLLADPGAHWQLQEELETAGAEDTGLHALALHKLVQRRLFLQHADRQNIEITGKELEQAIVALRNRSPDLASFGVWMQSRGLDEQTLFDRLREDLRVKRVIAALVEDVKVSTQQVQDYYASRGEDLQSEAVRLRMIVVRSVEEAEAILAALRAGEDFSRLARQHSLGQRAAQGGDTGWHDLRKLAQPLRMAVDSLQTGEASHPLQRNTDEYLIVALQDRRPLPADTLEAARPVIEQRLLTTLRQEAVGTWLKQQESRSTIELLARQGDAEVAGASPGGG